MMQHLSVPKIQEIFQNFFFVVILYFYLFQPPVVPRIIYPIVELLILLIYVVLFERKFFYELFSNFKNECVLLLLIIIYSFLRDLISGEIVYFDRFLLWSFQSFVFGFFIIKIMQQRNEKRLFIRRKSAVNLFNLFYWAAFIASLITLLLILNPGFDRWYESVQLDAYYERYESFEFRYRAYGISENLTFTYSYVLGFFAGYSLLVLNEKKYLIIPFFSMLLGIVYNARIGFVAILIFLLIVVLQKRWKNILYFFILLVIVIGGYSFLSDEKILLNLLNNNWAIDFFYQVSDTFFGTNLSMYGNTFEFLSSSFFVFPQSLEEWIVGSGKSLFLAYENNTDIGYLLQLNYGGMVFLSLIMLFVIYTSIRLFKVLTSVHWFPLFFTLSVLILNFKGFIFAGTPGGRLLFLLYVYFIYNKRNEFIFAVRKFYFEKNKLYNTSSSTF